MRILVNALATSLLLILGTTASSFAQSDNGSIITILRGGTRPITVTNLPGSAARITNGVTIMTGMPIVSASPQQTSELPGAALAAGNAGFGAGATNPSGNAAAGANRNPTGVNTTRSAGRPGGTISAAPRGFGGARGGFGFK